MVGTLGGGVDGVGLVFGGTTGLSFLDTTGGLEVFFLETGKL
jgi:hypothetical protein